MAAEETGSSQKSLGRTRISAATTTETTSISQRSLSIRLTFASLDNLLLLLQHLVHINAIFQEADGNTDATFMSMSLSVAKSNRAQKCFSILPVGEYLA